MPLYEFRCPACGSIQELWRPIGDRGYVPSCSADPDCAGTPMTRLPSTLAIRGETVSRP